MAASEKDSQHWYNPQQLILVNNAEFALMPFIAQWPFTFYVFWQARNLFKLLAAAASEH